LKTRRFHGWRWGAVWGCWFALIPSAFAANTNPTLVFQTNRSNELSVIHPSGRSLLLPVYRISGYTNLYDQIISNQVFTSNNARWVRRSKPGSQRT